MKILLSEQIREADAYTIKYEPIASIDLMERAAKKIADWIAKHFEADRKINIFAGPGNNGGDGLALARILTDKGYNCFVFVPVFNSKQSPDFLINKERLITQGKATIQYLDATDNLPSFNNADVIVDGLFGTGISRPLHGFAAKIVEHINRADENVQIVAIDLPSGLFGEDNTANTSGTIIRAHHTLTFQCPKLAFMFPENHVYVGDWHILSIGLHPGFIDSAPSPYSIIEEQHIARLLKPRKKFSHKGTFGHGMIVAGSKGKMGAAVLSARAALRAGVGLLTVVAPECGNDIIQSSVPEAMTSPSGKDCIEAIDLVYGTTAIGIGPGIGKDEITARSLKGLLKNCKLPMILDADALNIISEHRDLLKLLGKDTILTPHPKEFERLAGTSENSYQRLQTQVSFSKKHNVIVVLKGAHTSVSFPDGSCCFNTTGNPGMATAGSGDVLTGIILSFLSQGYSPNESALLGVYIHGLAGDLAGIKISMESMVSGDIINNISDAFCQLNRVKKRIQ